MNNQFSISDDTSETLKLNNIIVRDVVFYLDSFCNLRCKHCYIGNELLKQHFDYEPNSIIKFLSQYDSLDRITILGGEPFLYKNINFILSKVNSFNINEKRITTNLTDISLLDTNILLNGDYRLAVSIDGHNQSLHDSIRGKNTFIKTLATIFISCIKT